MRQIRLGKKGFTLVEVIVVLVILAILIAISVPALTGYINEARLKKCSLQRRDLAVAFKAAYVQEDWLEVERKNQLKNKLNGKTLPVFLMDKQYYGSNKIQCPISQQEYNYSFLNEDGNFQIKFTCVCTEGSYAGRIDKYIASSQEALKAIIKGGNLYPGREAIIAEIYKQQDGLLEVDSSMTKNLKFKAGVAENLYWRPYYLKDGSVVLFAGTGDDKTHSQWRSYMMYVDGEVYVSNKKDSSGAVIYSDVAYIGQGNSSTGVTECDTTEKLLESFEKLNNFVPKIDK